MTRRPDWERRQRVVVDGRTVAEIRTECPDPVALCRAEMAKRGRTPITSLPREDERPVESHGGPHMRPGRAAHVLDMSVSPTMQRVVFSGRVTRIHGAP